MLLIKALAFFFNSDSLVIGLNSVALLVSKNVLAQWKPRFDDL